MEQSIKFEPKPSKKYPVQYIFSHAFTSLESLRGARLTASRKRPALPWEKQAPPPFIERRPRR
jgi:hypothetical protein